MAEVSECAGDAVVSLARVLTGHPDNERFDFRRDRGTARIGAAFGAVELQGDQSAVPGQDGVGERD
jgi:hypothetical protein